MLGNCHRKYLILRDSCWTARIDVTKGASELLYISEHQLQLVAACLNFPPVVLPVICADRSTFLEYFEEGVIEGKRCLMRSNTGILAGVQSWPSEISALIRSQSHTAAHVSSKVCCGLVVTNYIVDSAPLHFYPPRIRHVHENANKMTYGDLLLADWRLQRRRRDYDRLVTALSGSLFLKIDCNMGQFGMIRLR